MTLQLDIGGHPIHTRALAVTISAGDGGRWDVFGYVLDLRQRGFVPVGSELQGMGIIHHMELAAQVDPATATLITLEPRQPTVAFEAGASTRGESCRDPIGRLQSLVGSRLDEGFNSQLRDSFGGLLGCSHLLALAQFLAPTVTHALNDRHRWSADVPTGQRLFRRDLIIDGHEIEEGQMAMGLQLADLSFEPTPAECLPMDRFASQFELRLRLDLEGWPATIAGIRGGQRQRRRDNFADAPWEDAANLFAPLLGMNLGKGAASNIVTHLATNPPAREALLMLSPALIQCRASFPDKWLNQVAGAPGHPGLIAMADSCYMWRRDGALAQVREDIVSRDS